MTYEHEIARQFRAQGRLSEAIVAYQTILARDGSDRITWHNLAAALGDAGRFDEAEAACRKALALGLDAAETWLVLGRALQQTGNLDEAQDALQAALQRKPKNATIHRTYAQLLWMRTGEADTALSHFAEALRRSPGDVGLQLALARVTSQMGNVDEGLKLARQAVRLLPESPIVQAAAAYAACAASQPHQALDYARAALVLSPFDHAAGMAEVQALFALGEVEAAAVRIAPLRERFPDNQYLTAMENTAWRLRGDPRYETISDYNKHVRAYEITAPSGWNSREHYLNDLNEALLARHPFTAHPFDQSVKGAGSQITGVELVTESAPLAAWPQAVLPALRDYIRRSQHTAKLTEESDDQLIGRLQTWSVRLKRTGYHTDHVHPNGLISSACHIAAPQSLTHGPGGWLRFGKPGIQTMPELDAEYFHRPESGVLILFPSYVWHGVAPFDEDGERLTVAMDVCQK